MEPQKLESYGILKVRKLWNFKSQSAEKQAVTVVKYIQCNFDPSSLQIPTKCT